MNSSSPLTTPSPRERDKVSVALSIEGGGNEVTPTVINGRTDVGDRFVVDSINVDGDNGWSIIDEVDGVTLVVEIVMQKEVIMHCVDADNSDDIGAGTGVDADVGTGIDDVSIGTDIAVVSNVDVPTVTGDVNVRTAVCDIMDGVDVVGDIDVWRATDDVWRATDDVTMTASVASVRTVMDDIDDEFVIVLYIVDAANVLGVVDTDSVIDAGSLVDAPNCGSVMQVDVMMQCVDGSDCVDDTVNVIEAVEDISDEVTVVIRCVVVFDTLQNIGISPEPLSSPLPLASPLPLPSPLPQLIAEQEELSAAEHTVIPYQLDTLHEVVILLTYY